MLIIEMALVQYRSSDLIISKWNEAFLIFLHSKFQSSNAENVMAYAVPTYQIFWAFGLIFLACELSQKVKDEFDDICEMIGQFDWYLLPYKLRRMLTIILINAQQPVYLECFGSFVCNRDTLKKVQRNDSKINIEFY